MGKRSPGRIEQLPSGSWRVKVYGETDPLTGREIRLRKTCKTERAAQIELGKLLEQASAGRQPETNAIVAELMDKYAEVADWDLSTRKAYVDGHRHDRSGGASVAVSRCRRADSSLRRGPAAHEAARHAARQPAKR